MNSPYIVDIAEIFTFFFIMLGPLRMLGPFSRDAKSLSPPQIHKIALQGAIISAIALIICGFIGKVLLDKWHIPVPILELTCGIIFAIVAFKLILRTKKEEVPAEKSPPLTGLSAALTMIITPYGAAILIGLLSMSQDGDRTLAIIACLLGVIVLDYLAMFFIRQIMGKTGMVVMSLLGVVLGVLQAALALNMIYVSLQALHGGLT